MATRIAKQNAMHSQGFTAEFGSRTEIGLVREHNEDSLIVMPPLYAVADGMGGHEAGEIASEITVNTLAELAPKHADAIQMVRAVEAANLDVIKAPSKGIGREGMGTTLTAAIIEDNRLLIAQVGDSRAYILSEGRLTQLTRDHSLMADMIDAGQITEAEARVHPNRSVITRAIGSDPFMRPDIYELAVNPGDRLLLCSDGLSAMVEDRTIASVMRRHFDPQECADALTEAALEAGGHDNVTVVVVDIPGTEKDRKRALKKYRRPKIWLGVVIAAVVLVFAAAAFGFNHYVNNSAYLAEEDGKVCIYQGVPEEFLGMNMSTLVEETDIDIDDLQPGVANRIRNVMQVDGVEEAQRLVEDYRAEIELSNVAEAPNSETAKAQAKAAAQSGSSTENAGGE